MHTYITFSSYESKRIYAPMAIAPQLVAQFADLDIVEQIGAFSANSVLRNLASLETPA
jgi:hypothetical protein